MFLRELTLINFRNYEECRLEFGPWINCFAGDNGSGKTNLLDAIHYLALCKSYFNPIDSQNIRHDAPFFVIQGQYAEGEKTEAIYCGVKRGQKKVFKRNQKEYERLADHIGAFPLVMISPADSELITGGSESRRKFMDSVISQYDPGYLDSLIRYGRALSQRNALLKTFGETGRFDKESLEVWDDQLIACGTPVFEERKRFITGFVPLVSSFYEQISGARENVELSYHSDLHKNTFRESLDAALRRDRAVEHSTAGIHKDDLEFLMDGHPVKKTGSQGQQKTFLLALKLAQFEFMRLKRPDKNPPVLLLDDIHDKLDEARMKKLMKMISDRRFGQVFITDTHAERLTGIFLELGMNCRIFKVEEGRALLQEVHEAPGSGWPGMPMESLH